MSMSRRYCLAIAFGFLVALLFSQSALAAEKKLSGSFNSDVQVPAGEYQALIVHLEPGDKMTLEVRVGQGGDIDVYTMAKKDYLDYQSPTSVQFGYYAQFSKENLKYLQYPMDFAPSEAGDYVIVLDNVLKTPSGATGTGTVLASVKLNVVYQQPFPWWIVAVVIVVAVGVAGALGFIMWQKKRMAEIEETDRQKKRAEAAKVRPIFIQQPTAAAPGAPTPGVMQAPPPSSTCKSCPHVYDPTSANCIGCEYR